jgi:hypothetical protein
MARSFTVVPNTIHEGAIEMASKNSTVTACFRNRFDASAAYDYAMGKGYTRDEVNVMMSNSTREAFEQESRHDVGSHATEGVAAGGTVGTAVGATAAAVAAIAAGVGMVALPGVGFLVAGPILAALMGGGAGAVAGGLIGGLIGLGIPESNARAYESALKDGGVVIGVHCRSGEDCSDIRKRFEELNGENIVTV